MKYKVQMDGNDGGGRVDCYFCGTTLVGMWHSKRQPALFDTETAALQAINDSSLGNDIYLIVPEDTLEQREGSHE